MTLVHTDSRRRVSLGRLLEANRDYRVTVSPHGTVTLEPVTTISDYERKLLMDEGITARLRNATAALDRGETEVRERRRRSADDPAPAGPSA